MSNPPIPPALTHCGGVITEATTREDLLARGFKPEAIDEVFAFRDRLAQKHRRTPELVSCQNEDE